MQADFRYDPEADAVYILLSDKAYHHGRVLDENRRLDYAEDETLIGVELLYVSGGVNVSGIPGEARTGRMLEEHGITVLAPA